MPDDKLVAHGGAGELIPQDALPDYDNFPPDDGGDGPGLDLGRYVHAVLRRKWLLALAVVLGLGAAAFAYRTVPVEYTATGNLWVQGARQQRGAGDVEPIRQSGLFEAGAWINLLRSYTVLDSVVIKQKLYLSTKADRRPAFAGFGLADSFKPGAYKLSVAENGENYTLSTKDGVFVERGALGDSIGRDLGFRWSPPARVFPAGSNVDFTVVPPRDASTALSERIETSMDPAGNFIGLKLTGPDPQRITAILNALMERHVALAAVLSKGKLDDVLKILQEQLEYAQQELERAEQNLEEFRVHTITLPSDASTPIAPGLELTRGPVFDSYFKMKVDLEQVSRDRVRLGAILDSLPAGGGIRVEALQSVPEVATSIELKKALDELVDDRAKLSVLRDRYADDYPPIQDLLTRIGTIERQTVPRVANSIMSEMKGRETSLRMRVDSASTELAAIPPRTIEEARLRRRVTAQENLYNELRQRVETARLASASSIPDVDILDRASVPQRPTSDNRLKFAAMFFAGPLGLAVALAILLDRTDPRLRYPMQVAREIGLNILGSIPRIQRGSKSEENSAHVIEAFRELRMTISFAYGSAGPATFVITSPGPGEGKSLVSSNLAVAFSEMGRRTLLIDADTRRGNAHALFGCHRVPGLTDYLRERSAGDIIQTTNYERLSFIGCGTRSDATPELLASSRMAEFLSTLKRAYDVVIVDTPPLAAGGDAVVLGALTGNLALVIRTGTTEKPLALAKLEALSRLPIRILGAILNDVEPRGTYFKYYSSYLKGYEPGDESSEDEARPPLLADVAGGKDQAS